MLPEVIVFSGLDTGISFKDPELVYWKSIEMNRPVIIPCLRVTVMEARKLGVQSLLCILPWQLSP